MKVRARSTAAVPAAMWRGAVASALEPSCGSCRYFCQQPHEIESQMPGLRSLSSAHASVRASDGICRRHDRYLGATSHCADYQQRM
jgi:hypothetical protein